MALLRILILLFLMIFLQACGDDEPEIKAELGSPEYRTMEFFNAIYIEDDLDKASQYASGKLNRVMKKYGTTRAVTRYLFNMRFDTVKMEIDRSGKNLRERYGDTAEIAILFSGTLHGEKKDDYRVVKLKKKGRDWVVEEVKHDPYGT